MRKLNWDSSFRRAFRRKARKNPQLQQKIFDVLDLLTKEPFNAQLRTPKLQGQLKGLWACRVEYDCRIVFAFESDPDTGEEMIALIDIGTHDEVY